MFADHITWYGKEHYEFLGLFIPKEKLTGIESHYEPGNGHAVLQSSGFECKFKPGVELQKLIDLGYTEEQGVVMLDALASAVDKEES